MSGVRRALAFSFLERYLLLAISLGSSVAIARLLTPGAIGIYSVSLAFVGVAQVLRDFGVASYLIQERDLGDEHVRTAFGVLLVLGGTLFVVLFLSAPAISRIYDEPSMAATLKICALNFLVLPFCTVSLALLRRSMAFQRLAVVNLIAAAAGAATSLALVLTDYGVISLAIGSVALNFVTGVGAWLARGDRRLHFPALSQWRRVIGFGAQTSAAGVVTSIAMDINDLAVGKILGFEPVAILSRAQGIMQLFHRDFMSAVRNVAYPAYASASRECMNMEPLYLKSVALVTVVAWPFYGFVSMFSLEILRLMFGPQWDAAAPLVPVFCMAGAVAATSSLVTSAVMAVGRVDLVTRAELLFQPCRAALVVAAALWFHSTLACAIALVVAMVLQVPLLYMQKGKCITNDYASLAAGLWASAKVTLVALAPPMLVMMTSSGRDVDGSVGWASLLAGAGLCVVGWIVAVLMFRHPLARDPGFTRVLARFGIARDPCV